MRRRLFLLAGLILLGGGLVKAELLQLRWPPISGLPTASAESTEVAFISSEELKHRLDLGEAIVVADVRRKDSFDKLHLAGALSMPMNDHAQWAPTLSKDVPLVMYCACEGDESALQAAREIHKRYGHRKVMVLQGGLGGWVDAGFPIIERKLPAGLKKMKVE